MASRAQVAGLVQQFLACKRFAVVGASTDRAKFGNKVLRALNAHAPGRVTPVHPKEKEIEGLQVQQLADVIASAASPEEVAISIITPPNVSTGVVKQAIEAGVKHIWLQPGAESGEAATLAAASNVPLLAFGPCVLVELGFEH